MSTDVTVKHRRSYSADLRRDVDRFAALSDAEKAAFLRQRIWFGAQRIVDALQHADETAAQEVADAETEIGILAQAEANILGIESNETVTTPPGWQLHTRSRLEEFIAERPRIRGILRETIYFRPEMQHDINRRIFSAVHGASDDPSRYAAELLADALTITKIPVS